MHLVIIDVIPALLEMEGRDASEGPSAAPGADHALQHLFERFPVVAIVDAGTSASAISDHLDAHQLRHYFDAVVSTAAHGPSINARVLRRMTAGRHQERPIMVTGRRHVADALAGSRIPVVFTRHEDFEGVADAVFSIIGGVGR